MYNQLTYEERVTFSTLKLQGLSVRKIATLMGRHFSTLYRELKRNRCYVTDSAYRPSKAERRTRARRRRSRRNKHFTQDDFQCVKELLAKKWSPEQISGYIRRFKLLKRPISYETIYQYIWEDKRNGGTLWQHLRQSAKKRRKRYNAYDSRGRRADKKHISERPLSVENKRVFGHWEIDTVFGKGSKHCIVTLVERKSKYLLIGKLSNKSTKELNQRVLKLILQNASRFKTITADNGTEFHQYQAIEELSGVTFYFATPYHSWERGLSENTNGLIRQYLPKNHSMEYVTQHQCNYIAKQLNQRPRKCLRYKTPEEVFNEH